MDVIEFLCMCEYVCMFVCLFVCVYVCVCVCVLKSLCVLNIGLMPATRVFRVRVG